MNFSENIPEINPVMMNYKLDMIRMGRQQGQWGVALHGQTAFSVIICSGRKMEKHGLDMWGYLQG